MNSSAGDPRWSPDSRQIAFDSRKEGRQNIYVVSSEGGEPRRLTTGEADNARPSWSRDGKWIYFGSNRSGDWQIWKMPAGGGAAVQLTRHGGREAFESWAGQFVYYAKSFGISGIWRVPPAGGEETQVLERGLQGYWALLRDGICLLNLDIGPGPAIEFFSFRSRRLKRIAMLPESAGRYPASDGYIAVSPDGQWFLYSQSDEVAEDIMLVEGFR